MKNDDRKHYLMGYKYDDYCIKFRKSSKSFKYKKTRFNILFDAYRRIAVGFYGIGMFIQGECVFRPGFVPDLQDADNLITGASHRFACEGLPYCGDEMDEFIAFSKRLIMILVPKLSLDQIPTTKQWLDSTTYSGKRKLALELDFYKIKQDYGKLRECKQFIKDEMYNEPKAARCINSYSDASKYWFGPVVKAFDKALFTGNPDVFVKGSDPKTWPLRMLELFGLGKCYETDFSSFESHHAGPMAKLFKFAMMHSIRDCGFSNSYKRDLSSFITGTNYCVNKFVKMSVKDRLMSGALWTSSANGLLNYCILHYTYTKSVGVDRPFRCLIEGDDGIFSSDDFDMSVVKRLGVRLELKSGSNFGELSFCGINCDPDQLTVLPDVMSIIRKFFYFEHRYIYIGIKKQKALLRSKALSLKYLYGNVPIIGHLCDSVLHHTRSFTPLTAETEWGKYSYVAQAVRDKVWKNKSSPSYQSRILIALRQGISIQEQMSVENIITSSANMRYDLHNIFCETWTMTDIQHAREFVSMETEVRARKATVPLPKSSGYKEYVNNGTSCDREIIT